MTPRSTRKRQRLEESPDFGTELEDWTPSLKARKRDATTQASSPKFQSSTRQKPLAITTEECAPPLPAAAVPAGSSENPGGSTARTIADAIAAVFSPGPMRSSPRVMRLRGRTPRQESKLSTSSTRGSCTSKGLIVPFPLSPRRSSSQEVMSVGELDPVGPVERLHCCARWLHLSAAAGERDRRVGWYEELCEGPPPSPTTIEQVEVDLPRSGLQQGAASSECTERFDALRRVLLAFARHDDATGYVQGMGDIAATALLASSTLDRSAEEGAFWWLVHVHEALLPAFFAPGMGAVWTELGVLERALRCVRPHVAEHLASAGCELACFAPSWYLTLFQRILDRSECHATLSALAAKTVAPTHVALGLLLALEAQLLATSSFEEMSVLLSSSIASKRAPPGVLAAACEAAASVPAERLHTFREIEAEGHAAQERLERK